MSNPFDEGLVAFLSTGDFPPSFRRAPNPDYLTVAPTVEVVRFFSYDMKTGTYRTDENEQIGVADSDFVGPLLVIENLGRRTLSRSMYRFNLDPKDARYTIRENTHTGERLWGYWSSDGIFVFNVSPKPVYFMD